MSFPSLSAINNQWWDDICLHVDKSVVYIDEAACECLHWNGGYSRLISANVKGVKSFSSFENAVPDQKKATFLISSPLLGAPLNTLQNILKANEFQRCLVLTSAHPSVHTIAFEGSSENDELLVFKELEKKLLLWMGVKNGKITIKYSPIFLAPLCPMFFVTPAFKMLYPCLSTDLRNIEFDQIMASKSDKKFPEHLNDVEFSNLPLHFQMTLMMFANCFNTFLEQLNVKEDYFTVGHCSRVLASVLEGLPAAKARKKNAQTKISVLFLDRTLDLVSPSGHGIDTLMDRILNLLPRFPGHKNDVAVDMHPVSSSVRSSFKSSVVLAPGCLAHDFQSSSSSILSSVILMKYKECVMETNRALVEVITKEKLLSEVPIKPGRISADTLENHIKLFRDKPEILKRHGSLVQSALAIVQALKHFNNSHLDQLYGIEKGLLQSLSEMNKSQSTLRQLTQLLKTRKERSIQIEEILALLIHVYSLAGDKIHDWKNEEDKLQEEIAKVLLEDSNELSDDFKNYIGECVDEYSAHSAVEDFFDRLHEIAALRNDMKKFRNIHDIGSKAQPATYNPLIQQILNDILSTSHPDLPDIEFRSAGLKNILKTGVSFFMNVNKPRPCDNPMLIFFIVGGMTTTEVRQIRETIINQRPDLQILIGSTQVVIPEDILYHTLNPSIKLTY